MLTDSEKRLVVEAMDGYPEGRGRFWYRDRNGGPALCCEDESLVEFGWPSIKLAAVRCLPAEKRFPAVASRALVDIYSSLRLDYTEYHKALDNPRQLAAKARRMWGLDGDK